MKHSLTDKSITPYEPETIRPRSLEVTQTYLRKGGSVTRSLWIRVAPRNLLLKTVLAVPLLAVATLIFLLFLIALGFVLLALVVITLAFRRGSREQSPR